MVQKTFLLLLCFFFLVLSSCYTITHPAPCPGLVEIDVACDEEELACSINN